jgi:hypothetical protein
MKLGFGDRAIAHLESVNGWTRYPGIADFYIEEAFKVWNFRSMHHWTLDVSFLARLGVEVPLELDRHREGAHREV